MRLVTLADGTADGALAVLSANGARLRRAAPIASTMQAALERWDEVAAPLAALLGARQSMRAPAWRRCRMPGSSSTRRPIAITPGELGPLWGDGRVCTALEVDYQGEQFGRARGEAMAFSFGALLAHAAATRDLPAGTVLGSGTLSNLTTPMLSAPAAFPSAARWR